MHWTKWSGCDWLVFGNLSSDILIILLPGLQMVRGALTLPHGTGKVWWYTFWILLSLSCVFCTEFFCLFFKTVRVAVFAEGPAADEARAAGADVVGGDELIEEICKGTLIRSVADLLYHIVHFPSTCMFSCVLCVVYLRNISMKLKDYIFLQLSLNIFIVTNLPFILFENPQLPFINLSLPRSVSYCLGIL